MDISYGSVCSGIEAASVAWEALGWRAAWFSQFDPEHNYARGPDFPSSVLAHHWPDVPNLGDMTKIASRIETGEIEAPRLLVGGTPCQAFSVAGYREGLNDGRGLLALEYVRLADAIDRKRAERGERPCVAAWENVPGVLSSKDNAFGSFLGLLAGEVEELEPPGGKWSNVGYVSGPARSIAWRIVDAKYFGVPQNRRRVLLVASADPRVDPGKILFEPEGGRVSPPLVIEGQERRARSVEGSTLYRFRRTDSYVSDGFSSTLAARDYKDARDLVVTADGRIRKLLPVEYERLFGFPDNYTLVPGATDTSRYKALGNSMAVPVMRWLAERIRQHI
jgi:site-specific DNA-cytosine methylase